MSSEGNRPDLSADQHRDAFARLFAEHHRWLYAYLVTLLSSPAHAEDVFQEVCVVLWRECEKFEMGTDFVKWVSVIAHHQVQKFRRMRKRSEQKLSETTLELIAHETADRHDLFESRRNALADCLKTLSERDRHLIGQCYGDRKSTVKNVAAQLGRPANTVYKAVNRIRGVLHRCIDRKLASERVS